MAVSKILIHQTILNILFSVFSTEFIKNIGEKELGLMCSDPKSGYYIFHEDFFVNLSFVHSYQNVDPSFKSPFFIPKNTRIEVAISNTNIQFYCGDKTNASNIFNDMFFDFHSGGELESTNLKVSSKTANFSACSKSELKRKMDSVFILKYEKGKFVLFYGCNSIFEFDGDYSEYAQGLLLLVSEPYINVDMHKLLREDDLKNHFLGNKHIKVPKNVQRYSYKNLKFSENQCERVKQQVLLCSNVEIPSVDYEMLVIGVCCVVLLFVAYFIFLFSFIKYSKK